MNKKIVIFLVFILSFILVSCTENNKTLSNDINDTDSNQQETKYNTYVKINNFFYDTVNEDLQYYNKSFGLDINNFNTDITCVVVSSIPDLYLEEFKEHIESLSDESKYEDINNAAKEIEPIIINLANTLKDAEFYYDSKNYIDDNCEKGKILHKDMCTIYDNYSKKLLSYNKLMKTLCLEQCDIDIKKFDNSNDNIKYQIINYMKSTYNFCCELLNDYDKESFDKNYTNLTNDIDSLMLAANNEDNKEERKSFSENNFKNFLDHCQETKATATDISTNLQNGEISTDLINELYGEFGAMVFYYNRVVEFSREVTNMNYFPII